MGRPRSKEELLQQSQEKFDHLLGLDPELSNKEFPSGTMNRNIRDVLGHLYFWQLMMLEWHSKGMKGQKPDMPAKGYSWKDTPRLNKDIWDKCQAYSFEEMMGLLKGTHKQLMDITAKFDANDLFEKKKFKWTGSTSVGAYMVSATSSHYDWAIKLIKKSLL